MHKIITIFLLFLCGCVQVGPDFKAPKADVQTNWSEGDNENIQTKEELSLVQWWEKFNDDTLNNLIEFALQENYNLEAAVYRIIAARANLGFAIGEWFPQTQQLEGSAFRTHLSANAPNTLNADRQYWDNILGLRLSWELDFWGRYFRGIQAAYGEFVATEHDFLDAQRILISDLASAYVQQKTLLKRIAVLDSNIAIQYRSVEIAKVRWEKGFESELDYAQAVTLWKETVAQKVALEIDLKQVTTTLAILTGLTPEKFSEQFCLDNTPLYIPLNAEISYPAQILVQRPDLQRSLDLLYAQCARVGIAISDFYPRISFTGFLGLECAADTENLATRKGKSFFSRNSLTFFYGPDFVWPILTYGRISSRVREQYALLDEGIALYRNQVLEAFKEVEDALTFYVKSIEETEELDVSYRHSKRAVDISTLQYKEGIADYTKVLNSLQLQVSAEDSLAQAEGNIGSAYIQIYRSLGSL